jgi:hypothetical protein
MFKPVPIAVAVFVLLFTGGVAFTLLRTSPPPATSVTATVRLQDGALLSLPPDLAGKNISVFGQEVSGDLDGDGRADLIALVTDVTDGSGTFFYAVGARGTADGYAPLTNMVFLGDRIAPQSSWYADGAAHIAYAERRKDEPMTARPSVGVSLTLRIEGTTLVSSAP